MSQLHQRLTGIDSPARISGERLSQFFTLSARRFRNKNPMPGVQEFLLLLSACIRGGADYAESLDWIRKRASGALRAELDNMLSYFEVGDTVANSLLSFERQTQIPDMKEVALKLALAQQLGSPAVKGLEAMTDSSAATSDAELTALGLRRENQMLYPLVFLVLPVTVIFVIFPSLRFLELVNL